jgi:GTP pyrophosphokinase
MAQNVEKALMIATKAHEGQTRDDGSPYIRHPIEVKNKLEKLNVPTCVLEAALLHDTVEDTQITVQDITNNLRNTRVTIMVDGLTKEKDINYYTKLKKFTRKNPWTIIIKMADRVHNLETSSHFDSKRKIKYYKETIEDLLPLFDEVCIKTSKGVKRCYRILRCDLERLLDNYLDN